MAGRPTKEVGLRHRVETRLDPATAGWLRGEPSGEPVMRGWVRLADGTEPDPFSLVLFADVLPPTSWAMGLYGWAPTVQLQVLVRALPAPGWCLVEARASRSPAAGWTRTTAIWDSTGRLVAQSRQLAARPAEASCGGPPGACERWGAGGPSCVLAQHGRGVGAVGGALRVERREQRDTAWPRRSARTAAPGTSSSGVGGRSRSTSSRR